MENKNMENIDILSELENLTNSQNIEIEQISENITSESISLEEENKPKEIFHNTSFDNLIKEAELTFQQEEEKHKTKKSLKTNILKNILFFFKYVSTSALIFAVLLITTNYNAYINLAMSYINKEEFNKNEELLISSVKASYIQEKIEEKKEKEEKTEEENLEENEISTTHKRNLHSIKKLINKTSKEDLNLNIEITPYENRVIIPKIGKNIPLLDVANQMVSSEKELNNIFMKELENGIIRYPGSAKPGDIGNSFIFGHSSNFPWIKGDYNEVFLFLDKLSYDDEVIVYYGQKKFTYKIKEKKVINPNNVSLLKRNKNKSEITLMTCWPIGTTLNRLIVTGELIEE